MVRTRTKSTATEDAQPERRASMSNESNNLSLEQEALVQVRLGELGRIMSKHDDLVSCPLLLLLALAHLRVVLAATRAVSIGELWSTFAI